MIPSILKRIFFTTFTLAGIIFNSTLESSTCTGVSVDACSEYKTESTCKSDYYVYFEHRSTATYCKWSNGQCFNDGAEVKC